MPHHHPQHCRKCGRHRDEAGPISATGQCGDCAEARYIANHRELQQHAGPHFEHWLARCRAAFGVPDPAAVHSAGDE